MTRDELLGEVRVVAFRALRHACVEAGLGNDLLSLVHHYYAARINGDAASLVDRVSVDLEMAARTRRWQAYIGRQTYWQPEHVLDAMMRGEEPPA